MDNLFAFLVLLGGKQQKDNPDGKFCVVALIIKYLILKKCFLLNHIGNTERSLLYFVRY